ncbi:VTT domain-containing protein, partial [Mycobacterium tuberculosis]|nr:VTT domain-containing protein [Mycobacterium tuberculosis]
SLASAIFWTTLGSIVGAIALYWIGIALGRRRLRIVVDKMPLVDLYDLDRTEAWFDRHGRKAVFFGRMVPIFRSLISIPAGIERMPFGLFVLL